MSSSPTDNTETVVLRPGRWKWAAVSMHLASTVPVLAFCCLFLYASVRWLLIDHTLYKFWAIGAAASVVTYACIYNLVSGLLKVHWADSRGALILTKQGLVAPAWRRLSYVFVPQAEPAMRWEHVEKVVCVGAVGASFSVVRFVPKNASHYVDSLDAALARPILEQKLGDDKALLAGPGDIQVMFCFLPPVPEILAALRKYPVHIAEETFAA